MTRLGQHFLRSKIIINKIIEAAEIEKDDIILEVGPGKGILTEVLLEKARKVVAVEKDTRLFEFLQNKFKDIKNLELIHGDILKINLPGKFGTKKFKIVANIPYYITSRFLRNFLENKNQPELMVLMLQKEVAKRIAAKTPRMSLLAISVQAYGEPKIIDQVSKRYFSPPPKVDSAIIKIEKISKDFFVKNNVEEKNFFELVKKGFAHKRKLLKNNLGISQDTIKKAGLSEKARAQELSLKDWGYLYHQI